MEPITFPCSVAKVTTMADGAYRVYLDLPETALMQAAELMACKRDGVYLEAVCTQKTPDGGGNTGKQRKSTF